MQFISQLGAMLTKHGPTIFTASAIGGVVATAIVAGKGAVKADRKIEEFDQEAGYRGAYSELKPIEKLKVVYKPFVPAVILGGLTIGFVVGAHVAHTRQTAMALGLLTASEKVYSEYREKIQETFGEEPERKVRETLAQEHQDATTAIYIPEDGKVPFYDALTDRYFLSDMETVRAAINDVNQTIIHVGCASQNELYSRLGLDGVLFGDEVGWDTDTLIEIDYHAVIDSKGKPAVSLDFRDRPRKV